MNEKTIRAVIREANKVIRDAKAVLENEMSAGGWGCYPSKKTGALRRHSMDLTRALAEMRRAG